MIYRFDVKITIIHLNTERGNTDMLAHACGARRLRQRAAEVEANRELCAVSIRPAEAVRPRL